MNYSLSDKNIGRVHAWARVSRCVFSERMGRRRTKDGLFRCKRFEGFMAVNIHVVMF